MKKEALIQELKASKEFFDRSTRVLEEQNSGYAPVDDAFTVAQQIGHVAQVVDWFVNGAKNGGNFDMDFAAHDEETRKVKSIAEARAKVDRAYADALNYIESSSMSDLEKLFPGDCILGPSPRYSIVSGIVEHTAHHRGALTVYSRLCGLVPSMPYMETQPA